MSTTTQTFTVTERTRRGYDKLYVDDIGDEKLVEMARQALTRPGDSAWWDEEMFVTHCQMFSTVDPDLSDDDLIGLSNYRSIGEALSAVWPNAVRESSFGHWTYSRFLALKVRVLRGDGSSGEIHPAFAAACSIALKLIDSPLYDDDAYSALEMAKWDEVDTAIAAELRARLTEDEDDEDFGLSDADVTLFVEDVLQYLHENDGQGYRSEFYYPDGVVSLARDWARARVGMVRHSYGDPALF